MLYHSIGMLSSGHIDMLPIYNRVHLNVFLFLFVAPVVLAQHLRGSEAHLMALVGIPLP